MSVLFNCKYTNEAMELSERFLAPSENVSVEVFLDYRIYLFLMFSEPKKIVNIL